MIVNYFMIEQDIVMTY